MSWFRPHKYQNPTGTISSSKRTTGLMRWFIRIFFLVGLLPYVQPIHAQSWLWAKSAGGAPNEESRCVRNDHEGNVIICGAFRTAVMAIGPLTVTNRSTVGTSDALVVKYDPQGNELWAVSMGGTNNDVARSLACDASGNVYVTGYFRSTVFYCGNDTLLNTGLTAADLFVTKIDSLGNVIWVRKLRGSGNDFSNSIDVDSVGNSYIAGYFTSDSLFVGPDTLVNPAPTVNDALILKIDSTGNFLWGRSLTGLGDDEGQGITIGPNNNIFFSGFFGSAEATIDSQSMTNPFPGFDQAFVLALNDTGQVMWSQSFGGSDHERIFAITSDNEGRVYATGRFGSPAFTFGSLAFTNASNALTADIFVIRIDPANGNPIWMQQAGGLFDDLGEGIGCDVNGNVIVTGRFSSDQLAFGVQTLVNALSPNSDVFLVEFDSLGSTRWAYREGEGLNEYGLSVSAFDSTVFLTGFYRDSVFNLLPFNLTNAFKGNQDLFVAALLQPSALPIELISLNASGVGSEVMLNWTTTQENNSDYFQLERSSDSREFDLVAKINAAGFSSTLTHYDFTDETPVIGYNYYRLCLFDLDGRKTYYGPVAVRIFKSGIDGVRVQLFANPDQLTIDIEGLIESFRIRIFDSAGKEIFHENDQCPSGSCRHSYETGILTQGIYVCLLESKSGIVACQRFSVRY